MSLVVLALGEPLDLIQLCGVYITIECLLQIVHRLFNKCLLLEFTALKDLDPR